MFEFAMSSGAPRPDSRQACSPPPKDLGYSQVQLALADIASVAREGLLAMSVAAGMAVMRTMFDAEITAACGPRGKHDPDRVATRHGGENGSVVLGGRRVPVNRPLLAPLTGTRWDCPPTSCSPQWTSPRRW